MFLHCNIFTYRFYIIDEKYQNKMDRFEIKTVTVYPEKIDKDTYTLNRILHVENKRIYFKRLEANEDFIININGIDFTSKDKALIPQNMFTTDFVRVINSNELRKDLVGTEYDDIWVRYIRSYSEYKISAPNLEFTYTYVVDNKTNKKKHKTKEKKKSNSEKPTDTDEINKKKWIDQEVKKSELIWNNVRLSLDSEEFNKLDDTSKLQFYQSQYTRFNKQHPICVRFMVNHGKYNKEAFYKYMRKVATTKPGDTDEFLERQADYAVYLYKETTPKWNSHDASVIRQTTFTILKKESDSFKELQDNTEVIADCIEEEVLSEMRDELQKQIEELRKLDDPMSAIPRTCQDLRLWDAYVKQRDGLVSSDEESDAALDQE